MDDVVAALMSLRFMVFAGVLLALVGLEFAFPRRAIVSPRLRRWLTNFSIVALSAVVMRGLSAAAPALVAVGAALLVEQHGIGLFNNLGWPTIVEGVLAVLALDFAIWLQHYLSHRIGALWRIHQMHHADPEIDVSTALRFHPVEIVLSSLYKCAWVVLLGPSVAAVVAFEILLNACAMFNHANLRLPAGVDRVIRLLIVTPDMHRVHHSVIAREHHSNFGFNLSIWDYLFRTYTAEPAAGHLGMRIGLDGYAAEDASRLGWCLKLPFTPRRSSASAAPRQGHVEPS
jgi:sterol desaturase/sphingolipid hydroxylase (fatty acid hydroxylase superfamily)